MPRLGTDMAQTHAFGIEIRYVCHMVHFSCDSYDS